MAMVTLEIHLDARAIAPVFASLIKAIGRLDDEKRAEILTLSQDPGAFFEVVEVPQDAGALRFSVLPNLRFRRLLECAGVA